jgi:hypothetical protein
MKGKLLPFRLGYNRMSETSIEGVRHMTNKRVYAWAARLAALLVAAALIPACSMLKSASSGGINWSSNSTGPVTTAAVPTNGPLWANPNNAIQGPIGIWNLGGTEITYGEADPTKYPSNNPEASHPVSTSQSLDPSGESIIDSMVQQTRTVVIGGVGGVGNVAGIGGVGGVGPTLYTGEPKLAGIARARAKHRSLHQGAAPPTDPDLPARLGYAKINPTYTNPAEYEASGPAMTATAAGNIIVAAVSGYTGGITANAYGAAGYWTGGNVNYFSFDIVEVATGGP